jgi:hypothetical protein
MSVPSDEAGAASVEAVSVGVLAADDGDEGVGVVECGSVIGVPMLSVTICAFANGSGADRVVCVDFGATCVCLSLITGTL